MQIHVSKIPERGLKKTFKAGLTHGDIQGAEEALISLDISKTEEIISVKGMLKSNIVLPCSRCLKEYSYPIEAPFEVQFMPSEKLTDGEDHELKEEEFNVFFYSEGILDFDNVIREQFILNLPMKPLCSVDCKGLCPLCGADLNERRCNCMDKQIDPRFAVLKKMMKGVENGKSNV